MANLLHADGLGNKGLSVVSFAENLGLQSITLRNYAEMAKYLAQDFIQKLVNGGFIHLQSCYAHQEKAEKIHRPRCVPSR
jgi:hypothetical protein